MAIAQPVDEAEAILARYATFRSMGLDELIAQDLAASDVTVAAVESLIRKGCPVELVARILA